MSEKETFYPKLDAKNDVVAREKMIIEYWLWFVYNIVIEDDMEVKVCI